MLAALALLASAACSTLPVASRPPFADHHVRAEFVVPEHGRLALPESRDDLVLRELSLVPPPLGEQFAHAQRCFLYAPGTRVQVEARFRVYGTDGHPPAPPEQVLVGATSVRSLAAP